MITEVDIELLVQAANLAEFDANVDDLELVTWNAGIETHIPTALLPGFSAVYIFEHNQQYLKVGQAGPNSSARYHSQHYNPNSCTSNLSKTLMRDNLYGYSQIVLNQVIGRWIKGNTSRYNILIPNHYDSRFVNFTEAFFILKCKPLFEY
jgi:hypothetical protein